jgi:hypothetical protein
MRLFQGRSCHKLPDGLSAGGTVLVFTVPSLPRHPPSGTAIRLPRLEAAAATAAKGGGYWARIHLGRTIRQQFGFGCSQPHRLTARTSDSGIAEQAVSFAAPKASAQAV